MSTAPILVSIADGIAYVTLNIPAKKNAMDLGLYKALAATLESIDKDGSVFCTCVTGRGDFFSAGADVKAVREVPGEGDSMKATMMRRLSEGNLSLSKAFYSHTKILVMALNGPAVGLSAALLGWADVVLAVENAWIMTPFSTISLVAEGGASLTFPQRMGVNRANRALIFGERLSAKELHECGFIAQLFPASDDRTFLRAVETYLVDKFTDLDTEACMITKALIKESLPSPDSANVREVFAGVERFVTGKPQIQFARLAAKTKRHKL